MKQITTALQNFLLTATEVLTCDLLTLTLQNGVTVYATNADVDVVWSGVTYLHGAVLFGRTKTSSGTQGKVADLQLDLYADSTITISGTPLLQLVRANAFDGATVRIDTLFLSSWTAPVGGVNNFLGLVSAIEAGRTSAKMTVKAPTHLFDTQMPRNFYQPGCLHVLYDSGCTINRASWAVTGVVQSSSGVSVGCSTLTQASGWFTRGYVQFTSGQNNGLRYSVSGSTQSIGFTMTRPPYYPIAAGDTFTIYPGCDRTQTTCTNKFSNLANFRAFPYVPVPETGV